MFMSYLTRRFRCMISMRLFIASTRDLMMSASEGTVGAVDDDGELGGDVAVL